jgi:hypothetical protein
MMTRPEPAEVPVESTTEDEKPAGPDLPDDDKPDEPAEVPVESATEDEKPAGPDLPDDEKPNDDDEFPNNDEPEEVPFESTTEDEKPAGPDLSDDEKPNDDDEFPNSGSTRAPIEQLTGRSRSRMEFTLRNAFCKWEAMLTLTYPKDFPTNGPQIKKDLNCFLTHVRKEYPAIKYFWWLEFQKRGAPHYHIYMTSYKDLNKERLKSGPV